MCFGWDEVRLVCLVGFVFRLNNYFVLGGLLICSL